jgi:hypothetical protein
MGKKRMRQRNVDGDDQPQKKRQHVEPAPAEMSRYGIPEGVVHYEHHTELPRDIRQCVFNPN